MKNNPIGFRLEKVTTLQFATIEDALTNKDSISINTTIGFGVNDTYRTISCICYIKFLSVESPFIVLDVQCDFSVEPSAWDKFYDATKDEITFEAGFMKHLAVLTVGTARGVLHAKTDNTKFNKYVLPTINVNDLVESNITFKF